MTTIEGIAFEVASHRALTDEHIMAQYGGWLLQQFEFVLRARWAEAMGLVTATEVALSRVLSLAFAKHTKKLPRLPTFDEAMGRKDKPATLAPVRTSWVNRFEQSNQIGGFRQDLDAELSEG